MLFAPSTSVGANDSGAPTAWAKKLPADICHFIAIALVAAWGTVQFHT